MGKLFSVTFMRPYWTYRKARKWLQENRIESLWDKDVRGKYIKLRIISNDEVYDHENIKIYKDEALHIEFEYEDGREDEWCSICKCLLTEINKTDESDTTCNKCEDECSLSSTFLLLEKVSRERKVEAMRKVEEKLQRVGLKLF